MGAGRVDAEAVNVGPGPSLPKADDVFEGAVSLSSLLGKGLAV